MPAKKIATVALMTAMLVAGKFSLSFVANVEIVTLLIVLFSTVFGRGFALPATLAFIAIETLIYGFSSWVVTYILFWPIVALCFGKEECKPIVRVVVVAALTVGFGVLSSLVDTLLLTGGTQNFWQKFAVMYGRGLVFYAVHLVSNVVIFSTIFTPLKTLLQKAVRWSV